MANIQPLGLATIGAGSQQSDESDDIVLATIKRLTSGTASAWTDNVVTGIIIGGGSALTSTLIDAGSGTLSFNALTAGISIDAATASNITVSGASADLTLGARATTITLNDSTHTLFSGTATSIVGGLNQSIHRLGTSTTIDLTSASDIDLLYTVPSGKTAIVTGAMIRIVTVSGTITVDASGGIGINTGAFDIIPDTTLDNTRAIDDAYSLNTTGKFILASAGDNINFEVGTASTGATSHLASVDLLGYLI
jgi:hypothetical protein